MKLFGPQYYKGFVCIADRCRHTCCVGWEIDVDEDAMERYASAEGYGAVVRGSIVIPETEEEVPHFGLVADERCPHLDEKGLCRIITELGEGFLCGICREHPRFYNDTAMGREVGLGMACEEACRLILDSEDYASMTEIGEVCGGSASEAEFDVLPFRERLYAILSDASLPYGERLSRIQAEFGVTPDLLSDEEWREVLASLEYLHEEHKALFACYSSKGTPDGKWEKQLERALAYFIYRHCTSAEDLWEFRGALGFCLVCERLLASMTADAESETDFAECARVLSEELEYSEDNTEAIKFEFYPFLGEE